MCDQQQEASARKKQCEECGQGFKGKGKLCRGCKKKKKNILLSLPILLVISQLLFGAEFFPFRYCDECGAKLPIGKRVCPG